MEIKCLGRETEMLVSALTGAGLSRLLKLLDNEGRVHLCRRLKDYGNNREERAANIRMHFIGCRGCREDYLGYLDRKAELALKLSGSRLKHSGSEYALAEIIRTAGYIDLIKAFDIVRLLPHLK